MRERWAMFCSTGEQNIWTKHSSEKYELKEREREREREGTWCEQWKSEQMRWEAGAVGFWIE